MKIVKFFVIQGFEEKDEHGNLRDVVTFEVIANDEKDAIKKANQIHKKPFHRLSSYFEHVEK